jgi:hypothetical protein
MIAVLAVPRPGLCLRTCAVLARLFVPRRTRHSWQWYRRAVGGQWSLRIDGALWMPVKTYPNII